MTAKSKIANAKHGSKISRNTENAPMSLNKNQQKQFNMVCERIARGESLRTICKDKDMPTARGVLKWLNADGNDAAVQQYARAREEQAEHHAAEMMAIADDLSIPVNDRRLMVDTRKWTASKLKPRVYGDRPQPGSDSDNPLHTVIEWVSVKPDDGK